MNCSDAGHDIVLNGSRENGTADGEDELDHQQSANNTPDTTRHSDDEAPALDSDVTRRRRSDVIKKERRPYIRRVGLVESAVEGFIGSYRKTRAWIFDPNDFSTRDGRAQIQAETTTESDDVQSESPHDEDDNEVTSCRSRDRVSIDVIGRRQLRASDVDKLLQRRRAKRRRTRWKHGKVLKDRQQTDEIDTGALDDYDWLAKYCIIHPDKVEMYKSTFDEVDETGKGHLDSIDTLIALRAVNPHLNDADEEYIFSILSMVGYNLDSGADYRLFAVLAALSYRITSVDDWMRTIINSIDCRSLVSKVYKCRTLWECCIESGYKTVSIDQLCVELQAGGVRSDHINQVRRKLGPPRGPLDLLDFLTYVPLFIMIHTSVVDNPLNDVCDK